MLNYFTYLIDLEFKKVRNQVKSLVKKAKQNMEKDIAKNAKTNLKKFWQYANSKRKTKSGIAELKYKNDKGEINITDATRIKPTSSVTVVCSPKNQKETCQHSKMQI